MFGCCRCTNPSKKEHKTKKNKRNVEECEPAENVDSNDSKIEIKVDHAKDIIEIRLKPDDTNDEQHDKTDGGNTATVSAESNLTLSEIKKVNNERHSTTKSLIEDPNVGKKSDTKINNSKNDNINIVSKSKNKNATNNLNNKNLTSKKCTKAEDNDDDDDDDNDDVVPKNTNLNNCVYSNNEDDDDGTKPLRKTSKDTLLSSEGGISTNGILKYPNVHTNTDSSVVVQYDANGIEIPKSCISRRSSSKSSIRKKVNINDSTEVIPSSELASIDDDEVFSDSVPPKIPRGDMCAPYIATKRGSFQGYFGYLPEWFNEDRFYTTNEQGGVLEPPVTPVGKDELALKRHRMYSELLMAAQAAVEHRVRFDPFGPDFAIPEDCDPDLKPSVAAELEKQVDRLEKLVERLERSVSAHQLDIANKAFNSVIQTKRRSFDIETAELPPIPNPISPSHGDDKSLVRRIDRLEDSLNKINYTNNENTFNCNTSNTINTNILNHNIESNCNYISKEQEGDGSLENIPTVLDEYLSEEGLDTQNQQSGRSIEAKESSNMSVNGYEDIILGPLAQYLNASNKIGGDVAKHAVLVGKAFDAQFAYIKLATQIAQPQQNKQMELLKPTSDQIAAIQEFREKNRTSPHFNHLSAISESIPALGWVCVSPTPGPHVKEMNDAGQFYTNRVLKDWKDKNASHVEWARNWVQTLTDLQKYIKQYHTTGLVFSGKGQGGAIPPPPPGCPPPPPPPVLDMSSMSLATGDDRSALFAEINRGEDVTKGLRKVTADMQTHKNTTLRTGPAPFKAPTSSPSGPSKPVAPAAPVTKPPVFNRDGKKWIIEYQKSNPNLIIENAEMNNVVYMFRCENSTLVVKGKLNSVFFDSCKKCSLVVDSVVASIEFVNCQSVQMQVLQKCPTISIDKTDGCQMYLSKDSLDVEIVSSKSSEMNVMIPKGASGDYIEQPIPEQYKTLIKGNSLQTTCVESLG